MKNTELALSPAASATGLSAVALAFRRAVVTQCHPRMLAVLLLPFAIALLGGILLLWAFWTPLNDWWASQLGSWGVVNQMDQWLVAAGVVSFKLVLAPVLAAGVLLPMAGLLGLIIAAVVVMPIVLRHLERREYIGLARRGEHATVVGAWNAVWVGALFVVGWLVTMPLWLIPPLAVILPVFWWAFAFTRILRVDALIEHASTRERRWLWRRHNRQLWLLGFCLALLNLLPPAWLFMPVFSALVFAHFSLESLRQLRLQGDAGARLPTTG